MWIFITLVTAITVNVNDKTAVKQLNKLAAQRLNSFYITTGEGKTADGKGCLRQHRVDNDPTSFNWYECGVFWGALMDYSEISGDTQFLNTITNSVTLASYGKVGSFLGPDKTVSEVLHGVWNDDIMWWSLVPLAGARRFGIDQTMPGGIGYFQLAKNTYNEVFQLWTNECDGGIYWSRYRNSPKDNERYSKSAITNAQHLYSGSVLYSLTGDKTFLANSYKMFDWIAQKLVLSDYMTADGISVKSKLGDCTISIPKEGKTGVFTSHSYIPGTIVGAMATFYGVSKNTTHLSLAENIAKKALNQFQTNGIITDYCDPNCDVTSVNPKGTYLRGLGILYQKTLDQKLKDLIKNTVQKSTTAMLNTCDSNMKCNSASWAKPQILENNIHVAMNNLELLNTLSIILNGVNDDKLAPPTQPPPAAPVSDIDTNPTGGAAQNSFYIVSVFVLLATLIN
ncbi:hydrolase 76 protein [Boothiomyces sp. JEL0838]|nr:hydrolase 76 protein [Boothiomyces sp. JEL0838]